MTQINKPTDYFNTVLYTGNSSTQNVDVGFASDWQWIKSRSTTQGHTIYDNVRGQFKVLNSHLTSAEATETGGFTGMSGNNMQFNGDNGVRGDTNYNGTNYVAWNWKANGAGSTNYDGSITSTVSANTTAGFSIVSYTGTGANATVGHGLGVAPKLLILKSRTRSDGQWTVGSDMLGWSKFLYLDANSAEQTFNLYQNTAPTSSVFYLSGDGGVNQSGGNMIGYAFAEKVGYSKFGSYTGGGSSFPFIYTGFKPAWVMVKVTNDGDNWHIIDNKRDSFNTMDSHLFANLNTAETTSSSYNFDMLSNGFKPRSTNNAFNASGKPYIYMAFAEQPLVGTNNIPSTAR